MRLKYCFSIILILSAFLYSFAIDITGIITDIDNSPLPGASIVLKTLPDSTNITLKSAGIDGDFKIDKVKPGNYVLTISMTGMEPVNKYFSITDSSNNINLGNIKLSENAILLKEAVVTGVRAAVVAKQDTVEFNADSFHTSPNSTVDQLLKKLPGVEVGSDGSITSNGKTITKILIDGKEFFADDPQMASKNLPSNMVEKVQVIDRKSDFSRLTGVDDGEEETVINLKVKKDMNNGWFGNISA